MVGPGPLTAVKVLVCDVDGVLTDGSIIYGTGEAEAKVFNIKDGLAMKLAAWNALPVVWLTGRVSEAVARRARELDVRVYQGATDKGAGLRMVAADFGVTLAEVAYLADDLNDLPGLAIAGAPIAVADAAPEVLAAAAYVTTALGGRGAVREVIETILREQQRWQEAVDVYLAKLRGAQHGQ